MPSQFSQRASAVLQDSTLRTTLTRSTGRLTRWRREAFASGSEFAELQSAARAIRQHTLANLPELLQQLEARWVSQGCAVYRAPDPEAALHYIQGLIDRSGKRGSGRIGLVRVAKSRSAIADEIGIGSVLSAGDPDAIRLIEANLGDYVLRLAGDTPSHPIFPALHVRKEEVAVLFEEKLDMPQTLKVPGMARMARFKQRRELMQADIGIGEVTFAVAETGSLVLAGDLGSERLAATLPPIYVALLGIEQLVPTLEDLFFLLPLLSRSAEGRPLPTYVQFLHGPAGEDDPDGPEELHVVLLDNGRSQLLSNLASHTPFYHYSDPPPTGPPGVDATRLPPDDHVWYGSALACIHCGACVNACPVYREVGGHAYGGVYTGPIGAILSPLLVAPPVDPHGDAGGRSPWSRMPTPWRQSTAGQREETVRRGTSDHTTARRTDYTTPRRTDYTTPRSSDQAKKRPRDLGTPARYAAPTLKDRTELAHASTLCAACSDVCPVGIDLPGLLVALRRDPAIRSSSSLGERVCIKIWAWAMATPGRYRVLARLISIGGRLLGRQRIRRLPPPLHPWTQNRDFPRPARRSFRALWAERELAEAEG